MSLAEESEAASSFDDSEFGANVARRDFTLGAAAWLMSSAPAFAGGDKPDQYKLQKDYPKDAKNMLENMKTATAMARGTPNMDQTVTFTRSQMNDFVAFYRRQPKVSGMPSFSTLYTAINTLSGHYASYGNKYPVPEKRKTRLEVQYKEIDRALARGK
jgi:photosystem II Psb27 protein